MFAGPVCPHGRNPPLTVPALVRFGQLAAAIALASGCAGSIAGGEDTSPAPAGGSGSPAVPAACERDTTPARIWRLSDEEYRRAVGDLLPGVKVPEVSTPGRSNAEFVNAADL